MQNASQREIAWEAARGSFRGLKKAANPPSAIANIKEG
jgi:hypothetical protein